MTEHVVDLPGGPFAATVAVPGDKSLSHRALILAAIASGTSSLPGLGGGEDVRSTAAVLGRLGVDVDLDDGTVASGGIGAWEQPGDALDCGNSGTTMRLMAGAAAASPIELTLVGDGSLMQRPMGRLVAPLGALGARVTVGEDGRPPVTVRGGPLHGANVAIPIASAQVRTAVALAALGAVGPTTITSPLGFRDHTERWLVSLGRAERPDEATLRVLPGPVPPLEVTIPGDPSSAAYLWAAAAVRPKAMVTTPDVSLNPGRLGFLAVLTEMGANVAVERTGDVLGDPRGTVTVRGPSALRGVAIGGATVAAAIDELPLVAVVAAVADGPTTVSGAVELRVKESDRLDAAVRLARLAGGRARATADGFVVGEGEAEDTDLIDANGDHRVAMSAAVAAVARLGSVSITGFDAVRVSWPGFATALEELWS